MASLTLAHRANIRAQKQRVNNTRINELEESSTFYDDSSSTPPTPSPLISDGEDVYRHKSMSRSSSVSSLSSRDSTSSHLESGATPAHECAAPPYDCASPPYEASTTTPPKYSRHTNPLWTNPVVPHVKEGNEALPAYSCSLALSGTYCMKRELSTPFLRAKRRNWHKVDLEIRGTTLRVRPSGSDLVKSSFAALKRKSNSSDSSQSLNFSFPDEVTRSYTLQFAEAGLAADYDSPAHAHPHLHEWVVRVRAESDQFLLAAPSARGVIELVETLNAASALALPIEMRSAWEVEIDNPCGVRRRMPRSSRRAERQRQTTHMRERHVALQPPGAAIPTSVNVSPPNVELHQIPRPEPTKQSQSQRADTDQFLDSRDRNRNIEETTSPSSSRPSQPQYQSSQSVSFTRMLVASVATSAAPAFTHRPNLNSSTSSPERINPGAQRHGVRHGGASARAGALAEAGANGCCPNCCVRTLKYAAPRRWDWVVMPRGKGVEGVESEIRLMRVGRRSTVERQEGEEATEGAQGEADDEGAGNS